MFSIPVAFLPWLPDPMWGGMIVGLAFLGIASLWYKNKKKKDAEFNEKFEAEKVRRAARGEE